MAICLLKTLRDKSDRWFMYSMAWKEGKDINRWDLPINNVLNDKLQHCAFIYIESNYFILVRVFLPSATKLRRLCFYVCHSVHKGGGW